MSETTTKQATCDATVFVPVKDEWGKPLPPDEKKCERAANTLVVLLFSGVETRTCKAHARRFKKRPWLYEVVEMGTR